MKHECYIINDEEIALIERYEGTISSRKDPQRYDGFRAEDLADFCRMKDKSNDMFFRRYHAAMEVIDLIAQHVGIDPENTSFWLYTPDADGTSPIVKKSRNGLAAAARRQNSKGAFKNWSKRTRYFGRSFRDKESRVHPA